MSFARPTLQEITRRVFDDIETAMVGVNARLKRSLERAVGQSVASVSHTLHGHIQALHRDALQFDTVRGSYLRRWAGIFGVTPKQPSQARATFAFTGTNGRAIEAGTSVSVGGSDFTTDHEATIENGAAIAAATAVAVGTASNVDAGAVASLGSPITGVDAACAVVSLDIEAIDAENDDDLHARFMQRVRNPPKGGGSGDYVAWALETPTVGIERAWEYPRFLGGGTVGVVVAKELTDLESDGTDQIPTVAEVAAVHAHIGQHAPTNAYRYTYAPISQPLNPTIRLRDDSPALRAAVTRSLNTYLRTVEPGSVVNRTSRTVVLSQLREAISQADGETDHELVNPTADVFSQFGHLPILGTPVFSAMT